jgi:ribonuclease VapC
VDELLNLNKMQIVEFGADQTGHAADARMRFGRGTGHPAQLNLGDCFSYALAKARDIPLLFKGENLIHTELASALPQAV